MSCRNEMSSHLSLVPRTSFSGPALELDFADLHIGVAEYDEGPTGAAVFYFPAGVMAAVDVRGAAAATVNTERLRASVYPPEPRNVLGAAS